MVVMRRVEVSGSIGTLVNAMARHPPSIRVSAIRRCSRDVRVTLSSSCVSRPRLADTKRTISARSKAANAGVAAGIERPPGSVPSGRESVTCVGQRMPSAVRLVVRGLSLSWLILITSFRHGSTQRASRSAEGALLFSPYRTLLTRAVKTCRNFEEQKR